MLRAIKKQTRKRSVQPQGDTIYRAAAVTAALMVLAAARFLISAGRLGFRVIEDGCRTNQLSSECSSSSYRKLARRTVRRKSSPCMETVMHIS